MLREDSAIPDVVMKSVSKRYDQGPAILENIDLSIGKGEFVSLIGPSGCGKSTILKLVAGLSAASAGSILVEGMTPANAREIVSFVFQDPTLLPWLTVAKNVGLGLELERVPQYSRDAKIRDLLELVKLSHVANAYPRQLSGGMKMRVSIARALSTRPRIVLMDEPFAALDEMSRDRMNEELLRLRREQDWTVLFVTHSVAEAVFLSTRVLVMAPHPGRIAKDIRNDLPYPRTPELRETRAFDDQVAMVSRVLRGVYTV